MITVNLKDIEEKAKDRPEGYLADVLAAGVINGGVVEFEEEKYGALIEKYSRYSQIKKELEEEILNSPPTLVEMASNFAQAFSKWSSAGFPVVTKEVFDSRIAICKSCPYWQETSRLGLGKCNHGSCGCTKAKAWLATEKCPVENW